MVFALTRALSGDYTNAIASCAVCQMCLCVLAFAVLRRTALEPEPLAPTGSAEGVGAREGAEGVEAKHSAPPAAKKPGPTERDALLPRPAP